jgi:hypothetical protein
MLNSSCFLGLVVAMVCGCATTGYQNDDARQETRPFYMGFTTWAYAPGEEALEKNYKMIKEHGDLITFQFNGGIPWPEAYAGTAYAPELEEKIASTLEHLKKGRKDRKLFLEIAALNMMRTGIAGYRGATESMPMPSPWDTYGFADEPVITAYSNFCIDVIGRLKPDYVNYSLEAGDQMVHDFEQWEDFVTFHKDVYENIKGVYPDLPLGISIPLKHPELEEAAIHQKHMKDILPYVDFLGASAYPFVFFGHADAGNPANLPERWFSQFIEMADGKPIAITETNWIAEDLVLAPWNINTPSTAAWQNDYVELLLKVASEHDALFITWWSIADFDQLWATFPEEVKDVGRIWRDTGLLDENLVARPGMATWDRWRALPVKQHRK